LRNQLFLARQEIPHILWDAKVHYIVHNSPQLVLTLSQINLVIALARCRADPF
jgi:hypothetical protein